MPRTTIVSFIIAVVYKQLNVWIVIIRESFFIIVFRNVAKVDIKATDPEIKADLKV